MAYASLLSLTQTIEQILQPQFHNEFPLFLDEEKLQLRSLHEKISNLLLFLENSSPNINSNSETTSSLEARIRDAAYEAEDLVESHMTRKSVAAAYEAQHLVPSHTNVISDEFSMSTSEIFEERLQNVIKKLSLISKVVDKIKLKANNVIGDEALHPLQTIATIEMEAVEEEVKVDPWLSSGVSSSESTSSDKSSMDPLKSNAAIEMEGVEEEVKVHPSTSLGAASSEPTSSDKSSMVGFKNDMLQIKDILTRLSTDQLEIISLVGMGGIGKTTLATNIYNDLSVIDRFDIRAWVTISQEYNMTELLKRLLKSMGEATAQINRMDEQELKMKLYQSLKQRRYLIVMDDVWDDYILEKFRNIFPDDNNGSRIIMTSRSSKVASSHSFCNHIHYLKFLSLDQSWNLLCQKAFGEERCPPALKDIGKRIANNCNGLALSLVAIGGVLHKAEKSQAHWKYVEKNMKSVETGNYERSMQILSWSYNQLPHHLRPCFLYMGVFREDSVIRVDHLIMLWVANGFIKPNSSKTLEEMAMEYLKDLIDRSLIIVRKRCRSGHIKTCVMHDLMRSMCITKAQEEKFIVPNSLSQTSPLSLNGYRHLSLSKFHSRQSQFGDVSTLRSIRCPKDEMQKIRSFQCLKVFDGCRMRFERFPIELVQLVNLRFIALIQIGTGEIPVSLSKLRFLQTLLIFNEYSIKGTVIIIPLEILKMPQLMHLWVEKSVLPDCSGGRVEKLHTLCGVKNVRFTEEAIATFPNLKKLKVEYDSEESALGSCFENIAYLCQLEHLKIVYSPTLMPRLIQCDLAFPVTLRKLSLRGIILSQRQLSTIGKLSNLEVLKLNLVDFPDGWKIEEGEFGELKFLLVYVSSYKFFWNLEGMHFPSLERLTCIGPYICLPSEIGEIPSLKVINLHECLQSAVDSVKKILKNIQEDREEWGYDTLQINFYPRYSLVGRGLRSYMLYGLDTAN